MLFLLNNPGIAFILLVVIGFTVLMGAKIFEEIKLNSALSLKQRQMRISTPLKSFKTRIALMSSAALAPVVAVVIVATIALSPQASLPTGDLVAVNSANDIMDIYTTFQERMGSNYDTFGWGLRTFDGTVGAPEANFDTTNVLTSDDGTENADSGSDDYSGTNNQVIGVEEMDNVLTDGKYIYTMYQNKVQISLAYTTVDGPDVLSLYKTFTFSNEMCSGEQFYPMGMYVDDDYLVIIGNQYNFECKDYETEPGDDEGGETEPSYIEPYYWHQNSSHIKVLVFDKNNDFELQDEYLMNGYFTGTRKIENNLYIVTNNYIPFYDEDVDIDYYLSEYSVNGQVTKATYEDVVYIEGSNPNSFTTFYGIDLDTTQVDMETILGDSGYNLYVSNENIYLVGSVYYFWPMVDYVEVEEPVYESKTAIMKVAIDDGEVEYKGTGMVSGYTLNQFSIDEYNGYLRITTTSGWGEETNNRLYVLDENLVVVALLENLGKPNEQIKSTRFVGDYAYLVTFEQTDPFYVINLTDPTDPVIEGELEIPGFSTYLQPLGEDFMLGIGFGDNSGGTQGLKISIYDISDKSNPFVFDEIIFDYSEFGWANSTVTYNHKDLLVSLSKGIIALPFTTYNFGDSGYSYTSGILVYNIDLVTGFTFNGYVTHAADSADAESAYDVYVYKSKFIDDYFYTISNKYIKVSTIEDTQTILDSIDLN